MRNSAECHPERFVKAHGLCPSCYHKHLSTVNPGYGERQRGWRRQNPDKARRLRRAYYWRNVDAIKARHAKKWSDLSPDERWERNLRGTYGLTAAEYRKMLEEQGGVCIVCSEPPADGTRLLVDHDHDTDKVRGLLCQRCNSLVGYLETSSQDVLERAKEYLAHAG